MAAVAELIRPDTNVVSDKQAIITLRKHRPMVESEGQAGEMEMISASMIEAGIDIYFGLCDQDWEDDPRHCVAEIIRAAFAARLKFYPPPFQQRMLL